MKVGDQNCKNPGILRFYSPNSEVLPHNGMIIIFPADRYHSVIYDGKADRVIIGVNFYTLYKILYYKIIYGYNYIFLNKERRSIN